MLMKLNFLPNSKSVVLLVTLTLIIGGIGAQANGLFNTTESGYIVCVQAKTKVVTHPGTNNCPRGNKRIVLGAQGIAGISGVNGLNGKSLWNGISDPENIVGLAGDFYINTVSNTLFGPKDLNTGWQSGVSLVGSQGERGPRGSSGAVGAAGATGTNGTNGTNGVDGAAGTSGTTAVHYLEINQVILNGTVQSIAALSLPAGSYLLTFSGTAFATTGTDYVAARIAVVNPGNLGGSDAIMVSSSVNDGRAYLIKQKVITLVNAGVINVWGNTINGENKYVFGSILTALPVSSVNP